MRGNQQRASPPPMVQRSITMIRRRRRMAEVRMSALDGLTLLPFPKLPCDMNSRRGCTADTGRGAQPFERDAFSSMATENFSRAKNFFLLDFCSKSRLKLGKKEIFDRIFTYIDNIRSKPANLRGQEPRRIFIYLECSVEFLSLSQNFFFELHFQLRWRLGLIDGAEKRPAFEVRLDSSFNRNHVLIEISLVCCVGLIIIKKKTVR